jgi:hypothetical protein
MRSTAGALMRPASVSGLGRQPILRQGALLAGGTLLGLSLLLAILFAGRRLAGALSEALPPLAIVLFAAALVGGRLTLAAAARNWRTTPAIRIGATALATLATGTFLLAVSLPGSSPAAITAAWFLWTAGEAAAWTAVRPSLSLHAIRSSAAMHPQRSAPLELSRPAEPTAESPVDGELEEDEIPAGLVQRLERVASDEGETVYALMRVPLEPGSRLGIAHLAFCPPLASAPKLAATARDEWAGDVHITAAETYGARLEIRSSRPAQAGESVLVEVWSEAE